VKLSDRALAALAAFRARTASGQQSSRDLAAKLRDFFYDKQREFFRSPTKLRATRKTRRAGATTGGVRELLARAIEIPGFRAIYVASTRIEAKARAWENDTRNGLVDVIREFGTQQDVRGVERYAFGGTFVDIRDGDLALEFDNGSRIELFGADDERSINKQRGRAKHVVWIDEAQDFRFLEKFYKSVVDPALHDFEGECWISGTPGQDCAGMFYDITKQDESDGPRLQGWEVHSIAQVDNPFFGATPEERWERTAGEAMRRNGWAADDPDLQREQLALWVRSDGNYVFAVHAVPDHELCYADARLLDDGFPDIEAAMADLPQRARRDYFCALGADLGTRDDFSFVLWAWSLQDPTLYEVASWKRPGLDYDEMYSHLVRVRERVSVGLVVADAGGGGKPAVMGWSKKWMDRYNVPIQEADKATLVEIQVKMMNNDIRTGKLRLRRGGVLLNEMRVLRWLKMRSATGLRIIDPKTPDHACDAGRYAFTHAFHHRAQVPEVKPPVGSLEHRQREELEHEQALEEQLDREEAWWS